jgi:hypothetical protein
VKSLISKIIDLKNKNEFKSNEHCEGGRKGGKDPLSLRRGKSLFQKAFSSSEVPLPGKFKRR